MLAGQTVSLSVAGQLLRLYVFMVHGAPQRAWQLLTCLTIRPLSSSEFLQLPPRPEGPIRKERL